jgi:hypothetical protein
MAKDLFNRYIWLVDTVYRAGKITFEALNRKWLRSDMSGGRDLPLRTFHNHRNAIEEMFDINIECDKQDGYTYYIENADDMEKGGVRAWLLNTFAVNNLINDSHKIKHRILFEWIPSGQRYLTPVIEAMRDGLRIEITHMSFWHEAPATFEIEPYCVKIFKQRWYVIALNRASGKIRTYALDRIRDIRITDVKFKFPKNFDPEHYFDESFGIIVNDDIKPCEVKIKVFGNKRNYFNTLPLHHSQQETETADDHSVFSYFLRPTYDFTQELLSHGNELEVIHPQWFKDELSQKKKEY